MNLHTYFSSVTKPVQACVAGSGGFGRSFIAQCRNTALLQCRAAVDIDAGTAVEAMVSVGINRQDIRVCTDRASALRAWEEGAYIAVADMDVLLDLPLDILVEATGSPVAGARHATLAIDAGWHVAIVSKEVDSVIGAGLAHKARQAGLVVTPVDGDQPSLLIGLVTWAQVLGLDIVAAGKASVYDFVYDADSGVIHSNGATRPVPGFDALWNMTQDKARDVVAARAAACAALPQRAVPDFCEMQIVANSTGLKPDTSEFHVPILRIAEVPQVLRPREEGGVLDKAGTLELFHCLRKPDELSFAGGVFVVVRCHDEDTWALLAGKGHVLAGDRKTALLYLPRHLLGLEAATSVIEAAGLRVSSGSPEPLPMLDLVGKAKTALTAGTKLSMGGHHHSIDAVAPALLPGAALAEDAPVPFYLMANLTLRRDVPAGEFIRLADVELEEGSSLLALRRYQDAVFHGQASTVAAPVFD
jgi:predicted homoserine dehydrogenase-like protein